MSSNVETGDTLLSDLRERVARREAVLIVGAGVSAAATENAPCASWKGLLDSGIDRCVDVAGLDSLSAEKLRRLLESSDIDFWLSVASAVEKKLKRTGGEYGMWLRDTVGSLEVKNPDLVQAIGKLDLPIWTTNYDNILEEVTGLQAITWRQGADLERVIRGDQRGIVHLHGHVNDHDSVVLGISSYDDLLRNERAQTALKALRSTKTLIFVGFGKGLNDPNFDAFLKWSQSVFSQSPYRHFRLARQSECQDIKADHDPDDRIFVLSYGTEYGDLIPFLESLCPERQNQDYKVSKVVLPPKEVTEQRRHESFDAEIELAAGYTKRGQPEIAIAQLEKLRTRHSSEFDNRIWFRVLANLGLAHEAKEEYEKAALFYLQAKDHTPQDVKARCLEAIAYFFREDAATAFSLAEKVRRDHPQSPLPNAVWVRSAPKTMSFAKMEKEIPEHLRESTEVANALMFAALREGQFVKAEDYGRSALAEETDSPALLEQLGGVLVEHARSQMAECGARRPSTKTRRLVEEADEHLNKALDLLGENGPFKARARIHLNLSMASNLVDRQDDVERHLRLAYEFAADNSSILTYFAIDLLDRKEWSAAIAIVTKLLKRHDRTFLKLLLARLYLSRNETADRDAARELLESQVDDLGSLEPCQQTECVSALLSIYAEMEIDEEAEKLLCRVEENPLSQLATKTLRVEFLHIRGNTESAKTEARDALSMLSDLDEAHTRRSLARELTTLGLYVDAHSIWLDLIEPTYFGPDTYMAVASAVHSDEAEFVMEFCSQLRANGFYDPDCIWAELGVLNDYNCVDTTDQVMEACLRETDDETFRCELRAQRSLLGLELGRGDWVTDSLEELPSAETTTPHMGRAVVQVLSSTADPMRGVRYAYELLRNNFASKDANMAMIGSILIGGKHGLDIPKFDEVVPGVAVALKEDDENAPRWWIIEEESNPERSRCELATDHPLAKGLLGKQVGDDFVIRESDLQRRVAKIVDIQSKYVFRFQQCMREFEEYFPGQTFLMKFSTKREGSEEPDLDFVQRSVERQIEFIRHLERAYDAALPSMNVFAARTGKHVFDAATYLAGHTLPIRCCHGTNKELEEASKALDSSDTIVVDGSALATLFITGTFRHLKDFGVRISITYGTLRGFRRLYMERLNSGEHGRFTKVGDQFTILECSPEERQRYLDEMREFIEVLEFVATVEEGRAFSSIPKDDRNKIDKSFGRAYGESMALARSRECSFWVDDLPLAQLASTSYGVKYAWTQGVFSHACEKGWLGHDTLHALSVKLLRFRYTNTRVFPEMVLYVTKQASWSTADADLSTVLSWFGNADVKPRTIAWVASNSIAKILLASEGQDKADEVVTFLLRQIKGRSDGAELLRQFRDNVSVNWEDISVDVARLKKLIERVLG